MNQTPELQQNLNKWKEITTKIRETDNTKTLLSAVGGLETLLGSLSNEQDIQKDESDGNSEEQNWEINAPFLYDHIMVHTLEWPSLSVDYLPGNYFSDEGESGQTLCLGTQTGNDSSSEILIVHVDMPDEKLKNPTFKDYGDYSGFGFGDGTKSKFTIIKRIFHGLDVNRVRYLPHKCNILAAIGTDGIVSIFDANKYETLVNNDIHPDQRTTDRTVKSHHKATPEITFKTLYGSEGYSLAWNKSNVGHLIAGNDCGHIAFWDILGAMHGTNEPIDTWKYGHAINDITWSTHHSQIALAAAENGCFLMIDSRCKNSQFGLDANISTKGLHCCVEHPLYDNVIVLGSVSNDILIIDRRRPQQIQATLSYHKNSILRLAFSPWSPFYLASSCNDGLVCIWNLDKMGSTCDSSLMDGPNELLMTHRGHETSVWDIAWSHHPNTQTTIATVSSDNLLELWKPNTTVIASDISCSASPNSSDIE